MPKITPPHQSELQSAEQVRASSVLFGLVIIAALIVAAAAWMGGSLGAVEKRFGGAMDATARSLGFSVQQVRIEGLDPKLSQDIRRVIDIEPGSNMFRASPHQIRDRIAQTGRVAGVSVYRLWPNVIVITGVPALPVAVFEDETGAVIVDSRGALRSDERLSDYPGLRTISGQGAPEAYAGLSRALAAHPSLDLQTVSAERVGTRRWRLDLATAVVDLPEDDRLPAALAFLADLDADTRLLQGGHTQLDLRPVAFDAETGEPRGSLVVTPRLIAPQASLERRTG